MVLNTERLDSAVKRWLMVEVWQGADVSGTMWPVNWHDVCFIRPKFGSRWVVRRCKLAVMHIRFVYTHMFVVPHAWWSEMSMMLRMVLSIDLFLWEVNRRLRVIYLVGIRNLKRQNAGEVRLDWCWGRFWVRKCCYARWNGGWAEEFELHSYVWRSKWMVKWDVYECSDRS